MSKHTNPADLDPRLLSTLKTIMSSLRKPVTGCPWDLEQTFDTIAPYTIEEAYEVAEAIANRDHDNLREELGDLLLQVVYHSQLASEDGLFELEDVIETINVKMVRRHPHVFGDDEARSAKLAKGFWENMKANERISKLGQADDTIPVNALDDVPLALPALTRADKLQKRAARVGFDWRDAMGPLAKVKEETRELEQVADTGDQSELEAELGDLLFSVVNLARHLDIDPEQALTRSSRKFQNRFQFIEASLNAEGSSATDVSLERLDELWIAAKASERTD